MRYFNVDSRENNQKNVDKYPLNKMKEKNYLVYRVIKNLIENCFHEVVLKAFFNKELYLFNM